MKKTSSSSNLNFTGRSHACIGETFFFNCSGGEGPELVWNVANTQFILPMQVATVESFDGDFSNNVTMYTGEKGLAQWSINPQKTLIQYYRLIYV